MTKNNTFSLRGCYLSEEALVKRVTRTEKVLYLSDSLTSGQRGAALLGSSKGPRAVEFEARSPGIPARAHKRERVNLTTFPLATKLRDRLDYWEKRNEALRPG